MKKRPEEGDIYRGNNFDTCGSKNLNCEDLFIYLFIYFFNLHSSSSLIHKCQNYFPYIYHPLQVFSSSLLMKTSCLRLKLVELNFLVSFNTDDQSKTDVANAINVNT